MYRCDYCKRYLKKKYDTCPGCGSDKFTRMESYDYMVIKEPPEGGYKVNLENYKIQKKPYSIPKWVMLIFLIISVLFCTVFIKTGIELIQEDGFAIAGGILFIFFALLMIISIITTTKKELKPFKDEEKKIENNMDKIKQLEKKGILVKNLPYELKIVDKKQVGKKIYYIHVVFEIEKGRTLSLKSEPRYLGALGRENGTVDVLIDPDDYSNYYIDFEIY